MKNLLLSICMLVATVLPGQTDSMIVKLDSAQVEALRFKGTHHPDLPISTHDTIVPQWHFWVPADQSVHLDYTGKLGDYERGTYTYLLPAEPDTLTTYKIAGGDTIPIYSTPSTNLWRRPIVVYNDGTTSDFITPAVLTIDQVKAIVSFPKYDPVYESCIRLIDLYYKMALQKGMSEPEAAHVALTKFGELMLSFNK